MRRAANQRNGRLCVAAPRDAASRQSCKSRNAACWLRLIAAEKKGARPGAGALCCQMEVPWIVCGCVQQLSRVALEQMWADCSREIAACQPLVTL